MPRIDDVVVLDAGICARPRRSRYLIPQVAGAHGLRDPRRLSPKEIPRVVLANRIDEGVADANRVVRVLTRNGLIRIALVRAVVAGRHERGDLFLFLYLPVDELLD